MEFFEKVKEFVNGAYTKVDKPVDHFEGTVKYILELNPDASEALLCAGYAHDVERAFRPGHIKLFINGLSIKDENYLKKHQEESAKIVSGFLRQENAPDNLIERVNYLVSCHEYGGDEEANILKDADSLSYFEYNFESFYLRWIKLGVPKESIREKCDWMFNRISSDKAKKLAKPMYDKALKMFGN